MVSDMLTQLQPVKSSSIAAVGYDAPSKRLHIKFTSGGTYVYQGVPAKEHQALLKADSIGTHFAQHIRDKRTFHRIDPDASAS